MKFYDEVADSLRRYHEFSACLVHEFRRIIKFQSIVHETEEPTLEVYVERTVVSWALKILGEYGHTIRDVC